MQWLIICNNKSYFESIFIYGNSEIFDTLAHSVKLNALNCANDYTKMAFQVSTRYAVHPTQCKEFDTEQLREHFLIDRLFKEDDIQLVYSHYDRLIVGGINPVAAELRLQPFNALKAEYFLERREIGIINVGHTGIVIADGEKFTLENKEALYLGKGTKSVSFQSSEPKHSALFYFNSAPAHTAYPARKISFLDADSTEIGTIENANQRTIRKLIVHPKIQSCQLQMGITELNKGSIWNTMPPHTHDRRMEAYFYFNLKEDNLVCHFMGEPTETRHIWTKNNQAVLSPPWSIHSGAGTSNYSFIWGMAGENLDYADMDQIKPQDLK